MIAVITGDIINSRKDQEFEWLQTLEQTLNRYGKEFEQWEIYRGDSFQMEMNPQKALRTAIHIKASIKQQKNIDVRMAIGIGSKNHTATNVTKSNGEAFVNSGECFDRLKKINLAIHTPWKDFDNEMNLYLELALLTMDGWPPVTAMVVTKTLENEGLNQIELSKLLHIKQGNISESLSRAGFDQILKMIQVYEQKIAALWS